MKKLLVFVGALLVTAAPAWATPLTITETTDFSNTSPGSLIGTLDVGVNTISGGVDFLSGDVADYFQLTLPAGMEIVQLQVSITGNPGILGITCPSPPCGSLPALTPGSFTTTGPGSPFTISANITIIASSLTFLGPSTFSDGFLSPSIGPLNGWQILSGGSYAYSEAYTVVSTGTVTPVPEPASLALLGTGLVATASRFRRRRSTPHISQ